MSDLIDGWNHIEGDVQFLKVLEVVDAGVFQGGDAVVGEVKLNEGCEEGEGVWDTHSEFNVVVLQV
jgi:hypothetical protein